jgi:DNA-directed RNA polymerase subunit RPC12/RpoP
MKRDLLKGLNEEQIAKIKACKTHEELLALAKKEGVELSEEQLAAVSGGGCMTYTVRCPKCGSNIIVEDCVGPKEYYCNNCGHEFDDNLWEDIKNLVD